MTQKRINILVTGADGQLGSELQTLGRGCSGFDFIFTDITTLDITSKEDVSRAVIDGNIDFIINCAAYTNVDKAEDNEQLCTKINSFGPQVLAEVAAQNSATLIHISTDYVFDGTAHLPYKEVDPTTPIGVYGRTKLVGEQVIVNSRCKSIIIRTAWLYSSFGNNFVKTMRRLGAERNELKVIFDQIGSPTYANDLAAAILEIIPQLNIEPRFAEIYHYTNEGVCSWYDFAVAILKDSSTTTNITPIETYEYPTKATRPNYSVLNKKKIRADFGVSTPHWQDALSRCLNLL